MLLVYKVVLLVVVDIKQEGEQEKSEENEQGEKNVEKYVKAITNSQYYISFHYL